MQKDHVPITVDQFRGTFDRGEDDVCPGDHFLDSLNVVFTEHGVETRKGSIEHFVLAGIRRIASYKRIGEADRLLILDSSGSIWDSTNLASSILTIAGMTDFGMVSLYNRAYITPHNSNKGLPGQKVYVYEGSGTARPAAGPAPIGPPIVAATSSTVGSVEIGKHLFAVSYETISGYLTQPGPATFTLYDAPGGKKVNLSSIPIGPAGTVARVLLATKKLATNYAGDAKNQEFFSIPNGRIGDNSTTTLTVDFFDADLQAGVDYLLDQLVEIPAGVGIGVYKSRLAVWGTDTNESAVYLSEPGQPESFSATEGFVLAFPGDASGGVKNCVEFRSQYYLLKGGGKTYVTSEIGDSPAFWEVVNVDLSIGAECHSIAKVMDQNGAALDNFFSADRSGLYLFNGTFSNNELSRKISDIWRRINRLALNQVEIVYDPIKALIYCAVPLDGADTPTHLLVGDVDDGIDPDNIRWTTWTFPKNPTSIVVDLNSLTKRTQFRFGSRQDNIYGYDESALNDFGQAIESFIETALLPPDAPEADPVIYQFGHLQLRAKGNGALNITISGIDRARSNQPAGISLSTQPGRTLERMLNFQDERASVKLQTFGATDHFQLTRLKLYATLLWTGRVNV
jgi:hypothetical protein